MSLRRDLDRRAARSTSSSLRSAGQGVLPRRVRVGPARRRSVPGDAEHRLDRRGADVRRRGGQDLARGGVDAGRPDARITQPPCDRHGRIEGQQVALERVGEVARVGREHHARGQIGARQPTGAVQEHDGLAGARTTRQAERAVPVPFDVAALLGVQEDPPLGERSVLDRAAQLVVVLEPRELHLGRGRAQALQ